MPSPAAEQLRAHVESVALVDHHVHGPFRADGPVSRFENALNEADTQPLPASLDPFDSQLGFAIRRYGSEVLDLPRHATPAEYLATRSHLGEAEVNRRFLSAAGVSDWIVDTGFASSELLDPHELGTLSGARGHEITRLEPLAEQLIASGATDFSTRFPAMLAERVAASGSIGVKSVIAYRCGFDVELARPSDTAVDSAAARFADGGGGGRIVDPVLLVFGLYAAVDLGLPLQLHVGFGDRDLDLRTVNPLLLREFLVVPEVAGTPVLLLHCYPFEREAGYLAQAFSNVHIDVGLAITHLGARSAALVARSLELAPFEKILYSSDAFGPAELHYLGATLWRRGMTEVLGEWVDSDQWSLTDAKRVVDLVARRNAERVYGPSVG